ncbi:zinc-binding dehydrogenase [Homoserinibacter sp. YIM 151385]|uniref:zinc-binding dehydrogenase n=1 Tax=Homoserinibacter sp. YIM 151385 TaxID=2985506 RepID=UPI0022F10046|nr:zinc-binding dehydrogenase [Homoserinibacter sp. YIM 151385]WBU37902.1 zinc-binding dehydrogenase [Homoserinibacter sp. YIM 151385]
MPDTEAPAEGATMLAAVWPGDEARLDIERIPVPVPKAGEALVRVAACGVCHTDLHVLKGEVAFPGPGVLGHEISGTVVAIGEGTADAGERRVGDRVVGAFIMPCTACESCLAGRDDVCEVFFAENRLKGNLLDGSSRLARADGSRLSMYSMAGLAEYAVVPLSALAAVPDELPLEEAAVLGCAAFTALGAIERSGLQAGESVAVVATGGVGTSILQIARHLGASPIIAVDIDDAKLEAARGLGADVVVNSMSVDAVEAVREATGGRGVHVAFEALGRPQTIETAVGALREGGRAVVVGIAAGAAAASIPITPLVRRGQALLGSFGARTRRDLPRVARLAAEGGFDVRRAVTRRYGIEDADEAYRELAAGRIPGRAIVVMSQVDVMSQADAGAAS